MKIVCQCDSLSFPTDLILVWGVKGEPGLGYALLNTDLNTDTRHTHYFWEAGMFSVHLWLIASRFIDFAKLRKPAIRYWGLLDKNASVTNGVPHVLLAKKTLETPPKKNSTISWCFFSLSTKTLGLYCWTLHTLFVWQREGNGTEPIA